MTSDLPPPMKAHRLNACTQKPAWCTPASLEVCPGGR